MCDTPGKPGGEMDYFAAHLGARVLGALYCAGRRGDHGEGEMVDRRDGCAGGIAGLAIRILRVHEPIPGEPTTEDLNDANHVVGRSSRAASHLALVGDKRILFNRPRNGFVMFGLAGKSCVALGDPVGPEVSIRELAWEFWEVCDVTGGRTVFYQVDEANLPLYVELGLALVKIGEEARVFLPDFDLEGSERRDLRLACQQMPQQNCEFEVVRPAAVKGMLNELRHVSDAWLEAKQVSEKGFSVGHFQQAFLQRNPLAVIRQREQILAFANLWQAADREELAIVMLRYTPAAPSGSPGSFRTSR